MNTTKYTSVKFTLLRAISGKEKWQLTKEFWFAKPLLREKVVQGNKDIEYVFQKW